MAELAADPLDATGGLDKRIRALDLTRAGLAAVRRRPATMLALWIAWTAAVLGMRWMNDHLPLQPGSVLPIRYADGALVGSLMSAVLLRLRLVPPRDRWRMDGRLVAYVALNTVFLAGLNVALTSLIARTPGLAASLPKALAMTGGGFVLFVVHTALILWPPGVLMGGPAANPVTAVRSLGGAVLSLIIALLLFTGTPGFLFGAGSAFAMVRLGGDLASLQTWVVYGRTPIAVLGELLTVVTAAELFRLRFLARRDIAATFD